MPECFSRSATSAQLRQKYRPVLFKADERGSLLSCCAILLWHFALAVAAAGLAEASFQVASGWGVFASFLAICVVGSRMRAWGNILHECSHNTYASSKVLNRWLGTLIGVILFMGFHRYRKEHLSHHRFLGDPQKDLDLGGKFFKPTLFSSEDPRIANVLRTLFLALVCILSLLPQTRLATWAFWIVPYFTSYPFFRYISDKADHAVISHEPDEFLRSRNHLLRWNWLNWLVFPHHDAYHLVHHLFPGLPSKRHQTCHALLLQEDVYSARKHVF